MCGWIVGIAQHTPSTETIDCKNLRRFNVKCLTFWLELLGHLYGHVM